MSARPSRCMARLPSASTATTSNPTTSSGRPTSDCAPADQRGNRRQRHHGERRQHHRPGRHRLVDLRDRSGREDRQRSGCQPQPSSAIASLTPPAPGPTAARRLGSSRAADRSTGNARRARRCPRPAAGRDRAAAPARASPAPAAGPARWTGDRPRTRRSPRAPAPRRPPPRPARRSPSSSTGTPARAAASRKPTPAARSAEPSPASRLIGSATRSPIRARAAAITAVLSRQPLVVDAGAPADHLVRGEPEASPRSARPPGWCCRCPCPRGSAGRRRRRSRSAAIGLPGQQRPPRTRPRSARPRGGSARTGRMWYAVTSAGRSARSSSSTPRSSTRSETPCWRASTLAPAGPATKARTMAAVTSRG